MAKKVNKSAKIRQLLDKGFSREHIVNKLGVSPQLVYAVARSVGKLRLKKKYKKPERESKIIRAVREMNTAIEKVKQDLVNNPPHYKVGGIDTLDFIEAKDLNFRLANVVKYVVRCGRKTDTDPVQDLEKAAFYLNREIEARKSA